MTYQCKGNIPQGLKPQFHSSCWNGEAESRGPSNLLMEYGGLVFEGDDSFAVAAEGGDFLQITVGLGQGHHGAVAVDGMAAGGEVPTSAFRVVREVAGGLANGLRGLRSRETKQQG
jgi:hypothetical protein